MTPDLEGEQFIDYVREASDELILYCSFVKLLKNKNFMMSWLFLQILKELLVKLFNTDKLFLLSITCLLF